MIIEAVTGTQKKNTNVISPATKLRQTEQHATLLGVRLSRNMARQPLLARM